MTRFAHGDRIRYSTTGDDGLPLVRYGFVGGVSDDGGPIVVMLDGELSGDVVDPTDIEPLVLAGSDLLDDPSLRQGLVNLWAAEAETAGLEIAGLRCIGTGVRDSSEGYALAELSSGTDQYVLRASLCALDHDAVMIRADRPNRWERP